MRAQARIAQDWLYYFGGLADKIEGPVIPLERQSILNYTLREPLGVVGVITPWNSPTFLAIMSLAPALAAGNTIVLKPSEITSASAVELAKLAEHAGIPPGVINVVSGFARDGRGARRSPARREGVVHRQRRRRARDRRARRTAAGQLMLELGGKSPNIVFEDANLDQAEAGVLAGIFAAAGQTCVAGSRAYIHASIYDAFVDRMVKRAAAITHRRSAGGGDADGPGRDESSSRRTSRWWQRAVAEGASCCAAAARPALAEFPDGFFYRADLSPADEGQLPDAQRGLRPGAGHDAVRATKRRSSRWPTTPSSASPPGSGRRTSAAPTGWRARSSRARCGSTPTGR